MEKRSVKEIMTVREFAHHSGLSECAVRKLLRERRVYSIKVGSRYYINYPKTIEVINFSLSEAIEKGVVSQLKIDNDICDGYVKIANEEIVTYTPYISCKNYTTKGYTKNLD